METTSMKNEKNIFKRVIIRFLGVLAKVAPGAEGLRPMLHRMRGVQIGSRVFIGEDVILETEYPECIEIQENVALSIRAVIIAHTRGPGKVVLEKNSFIGPNVVVVCPVGRTLTIGAGAVVSAGAVVTRSVPPKSMIAPPPSRTVATLEVPLTRDVSMEDFLAGMKMVKSPHNHR
jgi:acetyltransferase-like isoleucine patch superfamily enzyme